MPRGTFVSHDGERILLADYSHLVDIDEALREMDFVQTLIEAEAPGSVRYLLDVTALRFDARLVKRLQSLGARSKPYFRRSAIVGLSGLQSAVYRMLTRVLALDMPAFETREAALEYLTTRTESR